MYQRIHLWMDSLFNFNSIIINEMTTEMKWR